MPRTTPEKAWGATLALLAIHQLEEVIFPMGEWQERVGPSGWGCLDRFVATSPISSASFRQRLTVLGARYPRGHDRPVPRLGCRLRHARGDVGAYPVRDARRVDIDRTRSGRSRAGCPLHLAVSHLAARPRLSDLPRTGRRLRCCLIVRGWSTMPPLRTWCRGLVTVRPASARSLPRSAAVRRSLRATRTPPRRVRGTRRRPR